MTPPRSRASRREAARARERQGSSSKLLLPILGGGVLIVAAIAAIALTGGSGDGGGAASTIAPSTSAGSSAGPIGPEATPVITGGALPAFEDTAGDPAIGQAIPEVAGSDFAGTPVSITLDGRPKVLLFLAHWCGHCQYEVPVLQDWVDAGEAPEDVDLISVATSIDATLPNYPPEAWLEREGWTQPVIVDRAGSVATAYGLSAFPYWVFVDADGKVSGRMTGRLDMTSLETIIDSIR